MVTFPSRTNLSLIMSDLRQIAVEEKDGVAVVRFTNSKIIDRLMIQEMGDELQGLVENNDRKAILLNFDGVSFLSSEALGKLIKLNQTVNRVEGRLKMSNIRADIYDVFTIANLHTIFDIRETEEDALKAFAD